MRPILSNILIFTSYSNIFNKKSYFQSFNTSTIQQFNFNPINKKTDAKYLRLL